jgi:hypothetical protein
MDATTSLVARICHEVNRAYCKGIGDDSQPPWEDAPEWQRQATFELFASGAKSTAEERHDQWCESKHKAGWIYGAVKDATASPPTHPCLVPYAELPPEQRTKDALLNAIITSYARESAAA